MSNISFKTITKSDTLKMYKETGSKGNFKSYLWSLFKKGKINGAQYSEWNKSKLLNDITVL